MLIVCVVMMYIYIYVSAFYILVHVLCGCVMNVVCRVMIIID